MVYGSVCSGIEAATLAWHWLAEKNERGDYVLTAFNRETGEVLKVETKKI